MSDDTVFRAALDRGDRRSAAAWLVEKHAQDVLSLCRTMVTDPTLAEDLTQDTFHRALGGLATFRGDASARTWLLTIARHRCVDHLRRSARRPDRPYGKDEGEDEAIDDAPLTPDLLSHRSSVARALESLDETARALVVLRYHHGLGYAELADAYGLRPGAVRMRVSRALGTMRAALTARSAEAPLDRALQKAAPARMGSSTRRRTRSPGPPSPQSPPAASAPRPLGSGAGTPLPPAASAPRAARASGGRGDASAPLPRGRAFASVLGELQPAPSAGLRGRLEALVDAL